MPMSPEEIAQAEQAARDAVEGLPAHDTDPSDRTFPYSVRAGVADLLDDLDEQLERCETLLGDGEEGVYPGYQAVQHKLAEARGALMSALQAARQSEPGRMTVPN